MAATGQSLQDEFLNNLIKSKTPVSIFLVNGIKLQGRVEAFDQYVLFLRHFLFLTLHTIIPLLDRVLARSLIRLLSSGGSSPVPLL